MLKSDNKWESLYSQFSAPKRGCCFGYSDDQYHVNNEIGKDQAYFFL